MSFITAQDFPTGTSKLLPLQLAIIGPAPFVEAVDLLCSFKNIVNNHLETSKCVRGIAVRIPPGVLQVLLLFRVLP